MIKIDFNTTGAALMLDIFKRVKDKKVIDKDKIDSLMDTVVMKYYINHINESIKNEEKIERKDFIKVLSSLDKEDVKYDKKTLENLHVRYRELIEKVDLLKDTLNDITKKFNKDTTEEKLLKYLPEDFDLESTTYLICTEGSRSYFKEGNIILDLEFLSQNEYSPDGVVAHVLHHIAYSKINDNVVDDEGLPRKYTMIASIVNDLIGEGIGYFCMDTIPEEDQIGSNEFFKDVEKENIHFRDINNTIKKILRGSLDSRDEFNEWVNYHMSKEYGAINYIGIRMIETIETIYGREAIIKLLFEPHNLIEKYNEAAKVLIDRGEETFIFDSYVEEGVKELSQYVKKLEDGLT